MQVIKRDSRKKKFIPERISAAAGKAFIEVYEREDTEFNNKVLNGVLETLKQRGETIIPIEEIQDIIVDEIKLLDVAVALAYINYREERTFERDKKGELDKEIDNYN